MSLAAEQGLDYRIPVVFNLSSWAGKKQTIADWLVAELNSKYQIPKPIGQDWVKKQELLLLLDGLDEVKAEHRNSCVAALNDFHQNYAPEMVVCSRIKDYSALSNRLNFQSAIYLKSLTREQIRHYLDRINADLTGLRALIEGDRALQDLGKSPLMLNIMVLAYEGVAVEGLPKTEVVEERRKQLFNAYIERMFRRPTRLKVEQRYSESQTKRWLTWLAQRMVQNSQTVFFIEVMQPTWLQTFDKRILYRLGSLLISGLMSGLMGGLICGLSYGLTFKLMGGLVCRLMGGVIGGLMGGLVCGLNSGLNSGLMVGLIFGLISVRGKAEIKTVETLKWSWKEAKNGLMSGLMGGLILGLILGLRGGLRGGLILGLILGLRGGLIIGLIGSLVAGMKGSAIATKTIPNQGIYKTAMNAGIIGCISWLISGLMGLMGGLIFKLGYGVILGLLVGVILGLIALILKGGKACIRHFTLRLILYRNGYIPWNYARFLDYASDRIFLQKVGGGYIFIHRLLLEHFAQMRLES